MGNNGHFSGVNSADLGGNDFVITLHALNSETDFTSK
jgi:hypothetical protein